jgi:cytochrome c oxidase accessory protein FixG
MVVFLLLSMFVAHVFLAYFVGVDSLARWVWQSPLEHPVAFLVMTGTTLLMFLDFAWFREQTCIVACPYGRFQSVLLDRRSLIVGYDAGRGEPRGSARARKAAAARGAESHGDCIACNACVVTCPTGIDIRQGLQMECIGCTQCIDACDEVMEKIGKPRGLIRYSSQDGLAGRKSGILRPRTVVYPLALLLVFGALGFSLAGKSSADVTLLRGLGIPYSELASGEISNQIRIKVVNRGAEDRQYHFELLDLQEGSMIAPENPLTVPAGKAVTTAAFVNAPRELFASGEREVRLRISDGVDFDRTLPYRLLGPRAP